MGEMFHWPMCVYVSSFIGKPCHGMSKRMHLQKE